MVRRHLPNFIWSSRPDPPNFLRKEDPINCLGLGDGRAESGRGRFLGIGKNRAAVGKASWVASIWSLGAGGDANFVLGLKPIISFLVL